MLKYQTFLWAITGLLSTVGLPVLLLAAWHHSLEGAIPALATLGVAVTCCPRVPLRAYERWGLCILLLIFT